MAVLANRGGDTSDTRIVELDALRGVAVMGIALMNVYAFSLPLQAYYNPAVYGLESAVDRWVWLFSFLFVEDKFRTLFAILFGAGCLILFEKNEARPWRGHLARMATLFVIGLVHSILLASNDILRAYAIAGSFLPLLRALPPHSLYALSIGLLALHVGLGIVTFGSAIFDFYQGDLASDAYLFTERNFGSDPAAVRFTLELGAQDLPERVLRRSAAIPSQLAVIASSLALNAAAMVLGMALWKDRMLAGQWRTFRLQRVSAICAAIAIPGLLILEWWVSAAGFPGALVGAAALVLSAPFDTLLGLSYALLFMALVNKAARSTRVLAAVGRLSLTNYIATSFVFAGFFASWGLGWFGEVSRGQAFALSLVPIVAMGLWSPFWLGKFGQGPLERLWRSAARLLT